MGVHENKASWKITDGIPRRRPLRLLVLAALVGGASALLLAFSLGVWPFRIWHGEDLGTRFPPGALADYVPEDSAAVIAVNFRQVLESSIGQQHLTQWLQQLLARSARQLPWLEPIGITPLEDIDTLVISFPLSGGGEPVLLARGRIKPSRFHVGPGLLEEKRHERSGVWEYHDRPAKETTCLAVVGDMLVVSDTRNRVLAALKHASNPQPTSIRDAMLRDLLPKADRQQSLWLAASVKQLGPALGIDNYMLKMILHPLLAHSESVYGGIICAEDIRAELHFSTVTEKDATRLEADLKSICEAAPGVELLGRQNELLPLLRLLGAGQVRREGKSIVLYSRLTADQMDK